MRHRLPAQIVAKVDRPERGGSSMLESLTEVTVIEVLRRHIMALPAGATGRLAALGDPALGRCIALILGDARNDWTLAELARVSGLSRTALSERFEAVLDTSPIR